MKSALLVTKLFRFALLGALTVSASIAGSWRCVIAAELSGFTEPYRVIHVAADETGTVAEVLVREGESVAAGEPLARLNSQVHERLLAIAQQNMRAHGRIDAATADLQLRADRLEKLEQLRQEGHARQEEVDRARTEVEVAQANLRSAEEDQVTRRLEYERIKTQLERRTVRAPIAGVVKQLHKQLGEFVAPNSPDVLTIVDVDTLLANFTLLGRQAEKLTVNQQIDVRLEESQCQVAGTVEFISPVNDAESGTVLVKIRLANPDETIRSGERCFIVIED